MQHISFIDKCINSELNISHFGSNTLKKLSNIITHSCKSRRIKRISTKCDKNFNITNEDFFSHKLACNTDIIEICNTKVLYKLLETIDLNNLLIDKFYPSLHDPKNITQVYKLLIQRCINEDKEKLLIYYLVNNVLSKRVLDDDKYKGSKDQLIELIKNDKRTLYVYNLLKVWGLC